MGKGQRYQQYLIERYRALLGYAGVMLIISGGVILLPLVALLFFPDESYLADDFLVAGVPLMLGGLLLRLRFAPKGGLSLTFQEGTVLTLVVWVIAILVGAIPLMRVIGLNFTQAVFESTSGWTTTGLSVVDVTTTPQIILLYRSVIQLAGGAGFAIIALTVITGVASTGFSLAEGRSDQLAPQIHQSAAIVLRIYLAYIIFGVLALRLAGMGWFDAINHAFAAISTGGFSTRVESIGYWDNPLIEAIIIVLMILGTLNFLTAYTLSRRKFAPVWHNGEVRLLALMLPLMTILLFAVTTVQLYPALDKAARVAVFEVTSAISTTGFSTVSYLLWNQFGWLVLIVLMLLGGGSGSTAGGIKHARIYVLFKTIRWEIQRAFLPSHAVNQPALWQGERRMLLTDADVRRVSAFVFLYVLAFLIGVGIMAAHGYDLADSLFEFASSIGTVGLSVGITAASAPPLVLWTQTVGMFLGRLEFFPVFIGLFKLTSDAREFFARH